MTKNNNRNIIAISGRKCSGKSEISKLFIDAGFTKLSFADALKDLICKVLQISRKELDDRKEIENRFFLNEDQLKIISKETSFDLEIIKSYLGGKKFANIREFLQFLGTNVIRNEDPDWHIKQTKNRILDGINYVVDDLRFKNEKMALDELGSISFYIIRPSNWNISNHQSETELNWTNFENIFINNISLNSVKKKWAKFINSLKNPDFKSKELLIYGDKLNFRKFLIKNLQFKNTSELAEEIGCSRDKIVWWADKLLVKIPREKYKYNNECFLHPSHEAAYVFGLFMSDGCIKFQNNKNQSLISFTSTEIELAESVNNFLKTDRPICKRKCISAYSKKEIITYDIGCQNYLILENIKYWDFQPLKQNRITPPSIIKDNVDILKSWIVGLIDGDGSVYIDKKGNLGIQILATRQICEFIYKICPVKGYGPAQYKDTFLYEIKYYNKKAIAFDDWLNRKFGLKRKWNKVEEFRKSLDD